MSEDFSHYEARLTQLESVQRGLSDRFDAFAKDQERAFAQIDGKLERLLGARATMVAVATVLSSVAGSGLTHMVISFGGK